MRYFVKDRVVSRVEPRYFGVELKVRRLVLDWLVVKMQKHLPRQLGCVFLK